MTILRIIKKYPNRRLYDMTLRAYITLEDVKKLVFDHIKFQVIDARTQKDLTKSTLLQIIAEQEATSTPIFTTPMLQDFIRFYREKSQTLLGQYLEEAMHLFVQQKDLFQNQWQTYQKMFLHPAFSEHLTKEQKIRPKKLKKAKKTF